MTPRDDSDLIAELLAERALGGLSRAQEAQLRSLRPQAREELDDYELAAAALLLAFNDRLSPLPDALRKRLEASALDETPPPSN
jgi:hypothetical protein